MKWTGSSGQRHAWWASTRTTRGDHVCRGRLCQLCTAATRSRSTRPNSRKVILHPALKRHKPLLRVIVGGPGARQIETKGLPGDEWLIDCIVHGEAEAVVRPLFRAAFRGETLPRQVATESPALDKIPRIKHRSTFGVVEVTRGCGRGCQFCSVALRAGKSVPLDHVLDNVRLQVSEGADTIFVVTEDLFLYEQGPPVSDQRPRAAPAARSHRCRSGRRQHHAQPRHDGANRAHAGGRAGARRRGAEGAGPSSGLDAIRPALCDGVHRTRNRIGSSLQAVHEGKGYPFKPEQWPEVILKGMKTLNDHNWFPFCT